MHVHDRVEAVSLIHDGESCTGCVARDLKTGKLRVYLAKATLIATGGYGRLYSETTNTVINEGGGHIIAQDTGLVPFGNPEAVQFHPTGVVPTNILVTEGCRGDGGTLLDVDEKRFMDIYEPAKAELASRDVVSRWMMYHIAQGKGVPSPYGDHLWLDIRHPGGQAHHHQAARGLRPVPPFPGGKPHQPTHPGAPGPALLHGRSAHQQRRRGLRPQRAVLLRRVGLLGHARLQPPGRQLPGRDHRGRPPRGHQGSGVLGGGPRSLSTRAWPTRAW